jgi:RNA polymerase sigma-70 factor (ECF subfamily)
MTSSHAITAHPLTEYPPMYATEGENLDALFQRVLAEDYSAFERIFKLTYKSLCTFSNKIVGTYEIAEEVVDDVFCNLWKKRDRIQIDTSFRSYLFTAVRNKSLDSLRKMRREKNATLESADDIVCKQAIAYERMAFDELSHRIDRAIQELPRQCRAIFLMSRDQDLKYREIAEILNISIKTVDTQMGRALKSLRKAIAPPPR